MAEGGGGIGPWIPAIVGAAMDVGGMLFGKQQADTAHQREVKDLQRAGINPILTAQSRGAPVPDVPSFGDNVQRGVASALALQRQKSEILLLDSQSALARTQAADIATTGASGRYESIRRAADLANLDFEQRKQLLPIVVERARAEVLATTASARRSNALAVLDELSRTGAVNQQQLEDALGEGSPTLRLLLEIIRSTRR